MNIKILPYVIFLVVPILGRMTDSDDDARLLATSTFAILVKLVPLEVSRSVHLPIKLLRLTNSLRFRPAYPILRDSRPNWWKDGRPNETSSRNCWMEVRSRTTSFPSRCLSSCGSTSERGSTGWLS